MSVEEAILLQPSLVPRVSSCSEVPENLRHVARLDIYHPDQEGNILGSAGVFSYPGLEVKEIKSALGKPNTPYVPGLLSFRESQVLMRILEKLETRPDVIIADGHGLAHPRRFGIACHMELITDTPTIGCAKSMLRADMAF